MGGGSTKPVSSVETARAKKRAKAFVPQQMPIPRPSRDVPVPVRVSTGALCSTHTALVPRLMTMVYMLGHQLIDIAGLCLAGA